MINEKIQADVTTILQRMANETLDAAASLCDAVPDTIANCEHLGPMDPETGVRECGRETRGCLCAERIEVAEELANKIRALKL